MGEERRMTIEEYLIPSGGKKKKVSDQIEDVLQQDG